MTPLLEHYHCDSHDGMQCTQSTDHHHRCFTLDLQNPSFSTITNRHIINAVVTMLKCWITDKEKAVVSLGMLTGASMDIPGV